MENIKSIENEIISKIEKADNEKALEEIRISELGKKGRISNILKKVGSLSPDERKEIGSFINTLKKIITEKIREKRDYLLKIEIDTKLIKEKIDVTLPAQIKQQNNGFGAALRRPHRPLRVSSRVWRVLRLALACAKVSGGDPTD